MAMERLEPIYCVNRICKRTLASGTKNCPFCNTFQGEAGPPPPIPEMPRYVSGGWMDGPGGMMVTMGWLLLGGCTLFLVTSLPFWETLSHLALADWLRAEPVLGAVCLGLIWPLVSFLGGVGMLWGVARLSRAQPETILLPIVAVLGAIVLLVALMVPFLRTLALTYMVLLLGVGVRFGVPLLERD